MSRIRKPADPERQAQLQAELRRDRALKERDYRARALRMFPHLCARCGREFSGRRLRELTVHHKDHDHTHPKGEPQAQPEAPAAATPNCSGST